MAQLKATTVSGTLTVNNGDIVCTDSTIYGPGNFQINSDGSITMYNDIWIEDQSCSIYIKDGTGYRTIPTVSYSSGVLTIKV